MKWENGKNEPKASNVRKLSEILKVSESEICQGELQRMQMEPLEFVRRVGVLMDHVPVTEMLIGMHEYITDPEAFIDMLADASSYPYEVLEEEYKDAQRFQAKLTLEHLGKEPKDGEEEICKQAREHALKVLEGKV